MDYPQGAGVFIGLTELMAIFPRIKKGERAMAEEERRVLTKMEKALYEYLSVEEAEELLYGSAGRGKGDGR
ncbi:MAG: hypothetical protein LBH57_00005 [Treponema sp.]|nr:hypothetical protein [Treponema sp.]